MALDSATAAMCFTDVKMQRRRGVWGGTGLACHGYILRLRPRGGLQLLRLPGSLAENGTAAGIMLQLFRHPCYGTTPPALMQQGS